MLARARRFAARFALRSEVIAATGGGLARTIGAKTEMGSGAIAIPCRPGRVLTKKAEAVLWPEKRKIALADGMAGLERELRKLGRI